VQGELASPEHGEDGEHATLPAASTTASSRARWADVTIRSLPLGGANKYAASSEQRASSAQAAGQAAVAGRVRYHSARLESKGSTRMTNCPRCGASAAPQAANCTNCGNALAAWPQQQPQQQWPQQQAWAGAPAPLAAPVRARSGPPWKWIFVGCGGMLLLGVGFVVVLVLFVFGVTQPVVDASDRFMGDLKRADYVAAARMSTPALQAEIGGAAGLQRMVESGHARPKSWSYSSRNLQNGTGHVAGTAVFVDGGSGPVQITLEDHGGAWQVSAFKLR
jgi:hypothetical protein